MIRYFATPFLALALLVSAASAAQFAEALFAEK